MKRLKDPAYLIVLFLSVYAMSATVMTIASASMDIEDSPDTVSLWGLPDPPDSIGSLEWRLESDLAVEIAAFIGDYFGIPEDQIQPDTRFEEDLHADSVDAAEVVYLVCEKYFVPPPGYGVGTINELVMYIAGFQDSRSEATKDVEFTRQEFQLQTIFYATTRAVNDSRKVELHYGGERASAERGLHYGTCEVTIPVLRHKRGNIESPSLRRFEFRMDPRKHVVLKSINSLNEDVFWGQLDERFASVVDKVDPGLLLFIHGFNVSFSKAARRTAQMSYDLEFGGTPILFSWPSDGSLLSYLSDREDVEWSVNYLVKFLLELRQKSGSRKIHLMAHSMGSQVLIRALHRISLIYGDGEQMYENVILAAPDFDARTFTEDIFPETLGLANRWTLYASNKDAALDASRVLSTRRLGTPLPLANGMDIIDASDLEVSPWSAPEFHSYYASKLKVLNDIVGVIHGEAPSHRNLLPKNQGGREYWTIHFGNSSP